MVYEANSSMNIIKYDIKKYGKIAEAWGARSEKDPERIYTVTLSKDGVWSCACPRWTRNANRPDCKHIKHIKNFRQNGFQSAEVTEQVEKTLSRLGAVGGLMPQINEPINIGTKSVTLELKGIDEATETFDLIANKLTETRIEFRSEKRKRKPKKTLTRFSDLEL